MPDYRFMYDTGINMLMPLSSDSEAADLAASNPRIMFYYEEAPMPNPSEMHRLEVEARNEEYKKLEQSHNTLCTTAADVTRLVDLKMKIKTGYLSKGTKEYLLKEVRSIEKRLGIEGKNYNSGEF